MKKIIKVLLLTVSLLLTNFSANSFISLASEFPIIVEIEEYQEITDPYELLRLALLQYEDDKIESFCMDNETNGNISISQIIENKVFSNGSQERLYATTNFLILDENNQQVSIAQLLESNAEVDLNGNITSSGGNYNLAVSCTAYWEWKREGGYTMARCSHTINQVVGNTSGQYWVKQLDCAFKASDDIGNLPTYIDEVFIDYPTPYVMYTATNPNRMFFLDTPYFAIIAAGVVITYNDGTTYEIYIDIKAAINSTLWS